MNNKENSTWFRKSIRDGRNSHLIDILDWATMTEEDVIEISRNVEEICLSEMPGIMKCTELEYDFHYRGFAGGDDDIAAIRAHPFSPLTGKHVLNFCKFIEVHPADLVSTAVSPTSSIPPHLYQGLLLLKDIAIHQVDRQRAEAALRTERERYRRFVEANPIAADYFALVAEFDKERRTAADFKKAAVSTLKANKDQDLRPLLLKVFHDRSSGRSSFNSNAHFDDYHLHRLAHVDEKMKELVAQEGQYREKVTDLRAHLAMLYGMERAEFFYEALSFDVERLRGEKKAVVLDEMFEKAKKMGADEAVRYVCERTYELYKEGEAFLFGGRMLGEERAELGKYEEWLKSLQMAEGFHMLYLYMNQSASGHFEIARPLQIQDYSRREP